MRLSVRRPGALVLMVALALSTRAVVSRAQDTARGVRLGLRYTPGTKPGVLVLPANGEFADSARTILQRDFDFGDRINVVAIDAAALDSAPNSSRGDYNYPLYARLGAAAVVHPTLTASGIHVAVHDVTTQRVERTREFRLEGIPLSPEWRLSLHEVADEVEMWITGVRGVAATRILYVLGGRIWQVDSDGANATALTNAMGAMSPAWHPRGTHIAFAARGERDLRIILRDASGATRVIAGSAGSQYFSPAFGPDGSTLVYARAGEDGSTDLYAMNPFAAGPPRKITVGRGRASNSPTFSPDGRRIAYMSDRGGTQEIYVSDADGTNAEMLTPFKFGDQRERSGPDWSPDGRLIAFQGKIDGRFQLFTVSPRDRAPRQHTNDGGNEDPSWAPDSRHLVFASTRSGTRQLYVLDSESGRVRQLTHGAGGARLAAWSPLLRGR
jgi:TolB protein